MAAVHILIFGEMAGFKIAIHVKMIFFFFFFFSWSYEKKKIQPIRTRQFACKQLILNYSILKNFNTEWNAPRYTAIDKIENAVVANIVVF